VAPVKQIQFTSGVYPAPDEPFGQYAKDHWALESGVFGPSTPLSVCDDKVQNWAWFVSRPTGGDGGTPA